MKHVFTSAVSTNYSKLNPTDDKRSTYNKSTLKAHLLIECLAFCCQIAIKTYTTLSIGLDLMFKNCTSKACNATHDYNIPRL